MAYANYREIASYLNSRTPFTGSTMSATWEGDTYTVRSYATTIATVKGSEVWVSENKWGVTSGRHINMCRRAFL